ncbi:MAG: pilus assembly protein PilM [Patescibacteria group bacterium]
MLENFLENFKISNFFKKKNTSFLGVDIGGSAIKVVQLKKEKGVAVLETYGELSLGPTAGVEAGRATNLTDKQISVALMNLIQESRVNISNCGASIPVSSSLVFDMEIPKIPSEQLKKIVPIEVRRYIPVPISEVMLDWRIIPEDEFVEETDDVADTRLATEEKNNPNILYEPKKEEQKKRGKLKIFVVAIHKNAVEKYQSIIKNAQLNLNFLEIEIFSTIRSVVDHNIGTVAILDIGAGVTKMYIVEYGIVKDSHIISKGSQDISLAIARATGISIKEAEEKKRKIGLVGEDVNDKVISDIVSVNLKYILVEANKVLRQYQSDNNKNISELIFTGGGAVVNGLPPFASSVLEINSSVANPFNKIKTPAFLDDVLKEIGPEFAVAVGLALRGLE